MPHDVVQMLKDHMHEGGMALYSVVPKLITAVIDDRLWASQLDKAGQPFRSFEAWVTHPYWHGLESSVSDLLAYCRKSPEAQAAIRGAVGGIAAHGEVGNGRESRGSVTTSTKDRGQTYQLARLKRDRPDLAERVVTGELSAHAAAIEAGFRPKQLTVTARSRPETVAARLRETFGDEFVARLREVL